jgi:hypothetical protein
LAKNPRNSNSNRNSFSDLIDAPDYGDRQWWMTRGDGVGPGEILPDGVDRVPNADRKADCFFLHPTGYNQASTWNMPLTSGVRCEDTAKWTNAHQVSLHQSVFIVEV